MNCNHINLDLQKLFPPIFFVFFLMLLLYLGGTGESNFVYIHMLRNSCPCCWPKAVYDIEYTRWESDLRW